MCGIFGAVKQEQFLDLYDLNRKRGTFSTSLAILTTNSNVIVHRWSGTVAVKDIDKEIKKSLEDAKMSPLYLLGHTQAPTSSKRKYSRETSHPFNTENWVVAHNGVLTNFDEIKQQFDPKWKNPVDSSTIPLMLYKIQQAVNSQGHSVEIISTALSHLEGTFGLWIINTDYRGVYIARCGSTLFANKIDNTFSSVKFKGSEAVEEGVVYEVTPEGLTSVANFDFNSPFFS